MLGMEKKVRALYGDDVESELTPAVEAKETATSARAGMVLAILAILLSFGIYVALDAKLSDMANSAANVAALEAKVAALDTQVATFANLPAQIHKQLAAERVAAFAAAADRLAAGLDTPEHKATMAKIAAMAKALQADVAK